MKYNKKLFRNFLATASTLTIIMSSPHIVSATDHMTKATGNIATFSGKNLTKGHVKNGDKVIFNGIKELSADVPLEKIRVDANGKDGTSVKVNKDTNFAKFEDSVSDELINLIIKENATVTLEGSNADDMKQLGTIDGEEIGIVFGADNNLPQGVGSLYIKSSDKIYNDIGTKKTLATIKIHEGIETNIFSKNVITDFLDLSSSNIQLLLGEDTNLIASTIQVGSTMGSKHEWVDIIGKKGSRLTGEINFHGKGNHHTLGVATFNGDITLDDKTTLNFDSVSNITENDSINILGSIHTGKNNVIMAGDGDGETLKIIVEGDIGKDNPVKELVLMSANTTFTTHGAYLAINKVNFAVSGATLEFHPIGAPASYFINSTGVRSGNIEIAGQESVSVKGFDEESSLGQKEVIFIRNFMIDGISQQVMVVPQPTPAPLLNLNFNTVADNITFNIPVYVNNINISKSATSINFNKELVFKKLNVSSDSIIDLNDDVQEHANVSESQSQNKVIKIKNQIQFDADNITVNIADNKIFTPSVYTKRPGKGTLIFSGDRDISGEIGSKTHYLDKVILNKNSSRYNSQINLSKDIFARTIIATNTDLNILGARTIGVAGGSVDFSNSIINLDTNILTIPADITLSSSTKLNLKANGNYNGMIDNRDAGSVNFPDGMNISIKNENASNVTVGKSYVIYQGTNPTVGNINITSEDAGVNYSTRVEGGNLVAYVSQANNLAVNVMNNNVVNNIASGGIVGNVNIVSSSPVNQQASTNTKTSLTDLQSSQYSSVNAGDDSKKPLIVDQSKLPVHSAPISQAISSATSQTVHATLTNMTSAVSDRLASLNRTNFASIEGVAAGDEVDYIDIWSTGFGNISSQKMRNGEAGYKTSAAGGIVGFDTSLSKDVIFGSSITYYDSEVKHTDFEKGDKAKAKTLMLGVYGLYNITTEIFVQGIFNAGQTKVNSTRIENDTNLSMKGKYNIYNYGFSTIAGYNFKLDEYLFTPTVGLIYNQFNEDAYKETGLQKTIKVAKKEYNKIIARAGIKLSTLIENDGFRFVPDIHGYVNHTLNNKGIKNESSFEGTDSTIRTMGAKPAATSFNFGFGLMSEVKNFDCYLNYGMEVKSKFLGHQGAIKIRMNY